MESRQITDGRASVQLPKDVQDLLLGIPFAFHVPPSVLRNSQSDWYRK